MRKHFTHIWDIWEYAWFIEHPDMILAVPACAESCEMTRDDKRTLLVVPEALLKRGTAQDPDCEVCAIINLQIRQGTVQDPDIWYDLAEAPTGETAYVKPSERSFDDW